MPTTKKTASKKISLNENTIISAYMEEVLEENLSGNVYVFCKKNNIEETDFYLFFNSLKSIENRIWVKFFENTVSTLEKDASYDTYIEKNKLLSLYFTLFEVLTLNRSYVMSVLEKVNDDLKNLKQLHDFRDVFKKYITESIIDDSDQEIAKVRNFDRITKPLFSEGAWVQFLFILKFWMIDESKGFEKTDIIIEKSVNTVVDILDTKPLESLIDLGKFIWKEIAKSKMN
jgi:hypothetical protein